MKRIVVLILLLLFVQSPCNGSDLKELNNFVALFSKNGIITLSDYHRFHGNSSSKYETDFETNICKQKGWLHLDKKKANEYYDEKCIEFTRYRANNAEKVPSLYMEWLRKKLPVTPKLIILNIKSYSKEYEWVIINASFNDTPVLLRHMLTDRMIGPYGRIEVLEINGLSVYQMLSNHLKLKPNPKLNKSCY